MAIPMPDPDGPLGRNLALMETIAHTEAIIEKLRILITRLTQRLMSMPITLALEIHPGEFIIDVQGISNSMNPIYLSTLRRREVAQEELEEAEFTMQQLTIAWTERRRLLRS